MHPPPPGSIHLHPATSTSTQLILTSTKFHLPPPSSFQPPPSSLQHPQQYLNQNVARNWVISPNLGWKIKLSILTENWHTWYLGGVDSKSRFRLLIFWSQNPFLGKFGPKNWRLFVLSKNWCTKYLKDVDSKSRFIFLKFRPQNSFLGKFGPKHSKLSLLSENWCT